MSDPVIFLVMPHSGRSINSDSAWCFAHASRRYTVAHMRPMCSILPLAFNNGWCEMLNSRKKLGLTHFAMLHSDVVPRAPDDSRGWLDILMDEMESADADLVSGVVPIKDERGLTSTALDIGVPWAPKRLTLTEVYQRDLTFSDDKLLINTGMWLCKLDNWCEKMHFQQQDRVVRMDDGTFIPQTIPEDWDFSRRARHLGVGLYATRAVPIEHDHSRWHNRSPWGTWDTDKNFKAPAKEAAAA